MKILSNNKGSANEENPHIQIWKKQKYWFFHYIILNRIKWIPQWNSKISFTVVLTIPASDSTLLQK